MISYYDEFLNESLKLMATNITLYQTAQINNNNNEIKTISYDKEILSKCIDLISILCQTLPETIKKNPNKTKILEYVFYILEVKFFSLTFCLVQ